MSVLGLPTLGSALLAAAAIWTWCGRAHAARGRLTVLRRDDSPRPGKPTDARGVRGRLVAAMAGGTATTLLIGLPWGVLAGAGTAVVLTTVLGRMEPAAVRRRRERMAADLPIAVDLLAACLRAGSTPVDATDAVARALGGPLGSALDEVVALLRLGGDPAAVWVSLAADAELAPLGRAMARSTSTGAPPSAGLDQLAEDSRQSLRALADEAARKVGVKSAAPLGLCFLPAFVLLGVVPVVAGIASNIDLWY